MFNPVVERRKLDDIISRLALSSMRIAAIMFLAILATAGLCFVVLLFLPR